MKNHGKEVVAFLHDIYRVFKKHNLGIKSFDDNKKLIVQELDNKLIKQLFDAEDRFVPENNKKVNGNSLKHQIPKHKQK